MEGAINATAFLAWVKQELAPKVKPDDVVVMDTCIVQRKAGFVLLLINELAIDCVLNGKVADLGRAAHGLNGKIDALG